MRIIGKVCQVNNSLTFHGKPVRYEKFFNQVVETLGITIARRPMVRLREMGK